MKTSHLLIAAAGAYVAWRLYTRGQAYSFAARYPNAF
jgi:hypothetical protein